MRVLFFSLIAITVISCDGQKRVAQAEYPEFVWDDNGSPVSIENKEESIVEPTARTSQTTNLNQAVDEWIGTPYKWGGTTKSGADCSGFALRIYEDVYNKSLPGRRVEDFLQSVSFVSQTEAQPGDLVFFRMKGRRVDHVGIYLGNNAFAHASTSKGVIINSLSDAYYQKKMFKIGRPN